jgi:hypothetical protein
MFIICVLLSVVDLHRKEGMLITPFIFAPYMCSITAVKRADRVVRGNAVGIEEGDRSAGSNHEK